MGEEGASWGPPWEEGSVLHNLRNTSHFPSISQSLLFSDPLISYMDNVSVH